MKYFRDSHYPGYEESDGAFLVAYAYTSAVVALFSVVSL